MPEILRPSVYLNYIIELLAENIKVWNLKYPKFDFQNQSMTVSAKVPYLLRDMDTEMALELGVIYQNKYCEIKVNSQSISNNNQTIYNAIPDTCKQDLTVINQLLDTYQEQQYADIKVAYHKLKQREFDRELKNRELMEDFTHDIIENQLTNQICVEYSNGDVYIHAYNYKTDEYDNWLCMITPYGQLISQLAPNDSFANYGIQDILAKMAISYHLQTI